MLKIRLQRHGAAHAPVYRMVVSEARWKRDGRFVEILGTYSPQAKKAESEIMLKEDRLQHWLGVGAQPTDTVKGLIRKLRKQNQ